LYTKSTIRDHNKIGRLDLGEQVGNTRVGVRLGIEHQTSNSSRSNEQGSSDGDDGDSPGG